jgi:hypothetical protein
MALLLPCAVGRVGSIRRARPRLKAAVTWWVRPPPRAKRRRPLNRLELTRAGLKETMAFPPPPCAVRHVGSIRRPRPRLKPAVTWWVTPPPRAKRGRLLHRLELTRARLRERMALLRTCAVGHLRLIHRARPRLEAGVTRWVVRPLHRLESRRATLKKTMALLLPCAVGRVGSIRRPRPRLEAGGTRWVGSLNRLELKRARRVRLIRRPWWVRPSPRANRTSQSHDRFRPRNPPSL